ncbi:MAG: hypothetical protein GOVbin1678_46 [Prokaryotic dsDNA virus sp.]|nr:MAG: hypothetical protein GOVbin1678_46 [Prokaryotic dsDNA virus sp.]|tara:strand:+ start:24446 stop:24901 length:456 start_codon:yes stop_codon:yes gene_type:complete
MIAENKNKIELLFEITKEKMGVTKEQILGYDKPSEIAIARNIVASILHTELGLSYKDTGKEIKRDRTTIIYYAKNLDGNIRFNKNFRDNYNSISDTFWIKISRADVEDIELQIESLYQKIENLKKMKEKIVSLKTHQESISNEIKNSINQR